MNRLFSAAATATLAMGLATALVSAQDATPAVDLVTPSPEECQVEPRTIDNMMSFVATPAPVTSTPEPEISTPQPFAMPEGEPADAETIAGVTATATELTACLNANSGLQVFALYTDEYMARSFIDEGITEYAVEILATPIDPSPEADWSSVGVRDVQVLDDGRIGAYVVDQNPFGDGHTSERYTIFVEQDGRYLIDDIIFPTTGGE